MRPLRKAVIIVIRVYQKVLSPLKPRTCRFYPTCSEYAAQAIEKYGICRGLFKAIWRILRCHPFNPGGYDPV